MKFLRGLLHDLFGTLLFLMERGFNLVMFEFQNQKVKVGLTAVTVGRPIPS